ncbi:hypothetical protein LSAT2_004056 [Lamellibrachia satsuma]|nr:hypothetical protein LSAT2_004056 [Lamellibrachia satsuma]
MIVLWIAALALVSMSPPVVGKKSAIEKCKNMCAFFFYSCLNLTCPTGRWPRAVPQRCLDKREECMEKCLTSGNIRG